MEILVALEMVLYLQRCVHHCWWSSLTLAVGESNFTVALLPLERTEENKLVSYICKQYQSS
jgi:hypothetical protein